MSRPTIGGALGVAELTLLHRPAGAAQLTDALDHIRRALAALRAIDAATITGEQYSAIGRIAAALRDVTAALGRLHSSVTRGRP